LWKLEDEEWIEVPKFVPMGFLDGLFPQTPGETYSENFVDLSWFGDLDDGQYRMVRNFHQEGWNEARFRESGRLIFVVGVEFLLSQ
jgi:hypothetical protein